MQTMPGATSKELVTHSIFNSMAQMEIVYSLEERVEKQSTVILPDAPMGTH